MMKKQITTLFLAVVLTFSLAAVGFAEENRLKRLLTRMRLI